MGRGEGKQTPAAPENNLIRFQGILTAAFSNSRHRPSLGHPTPSPKLTTRLNERELGCRLRLQPAVVGGRLLHQGWDLLLPLGLPRQVRAEVRDVQPVCRGGDCRVYGKGLPQDLLQLHPMQVRSHSRRGAMAGKSLFMTCPLAID